MCKISNLIKIFIKHILSDLTNCLARSNGIIAVINNIINIITCHACN